MLPEPLNTFLKRKSKESRAHRRFDLRSYQLEIASRAFKILARGGNVVVDLPTGAGKTHVGILVALFARQSKPAGSAKVLYVVPSRILIDQVVQAAAWPDPEFTRVGITERVSANAFHLRAAVTSADIVITTPGLFASLLRRALLSPSDFLATLSVVVLDEFDEYLILEADRTGYHVRFDSSLIALRSFVGKCPTLLMSGTAPSALSTLLSSATPTYFAEYVKETYSPIRVSVHSASYRRYIPTALVRAVPCFDPYVVRCEKAIGYRIHREIEQYECDHHVRLDSAYLLSRLEGVAGGNISAVRLITGRFMRVDESLRRACRTLLDLLSKYQFLYEDMFRDIQAEQVRVPVIEDCVETDKRQTVYVLKDSRAARDRYAPDLRGKAHGILSLLRKHKAEKGLIFTRHIRLSDALKDFLEAQGVTVRQVDGRVKSDWERYDVLRRFQSSVDGVLIITRGTGRRGLDIPMADFAVLYSPKSDEYVVWQELSRIRSTLSRMKPSYILYYVDTTEHKRLERLRRDMLVSGHRYRFEDSGGFASREPC